MPWITKEATCLHESLASTGRLDPSKCREWKQLSNTVADIRLNFLGAASRGSFPPFDAGPLHISCVSATGNPCRRPKTHCPRRSATRHRRPQPTNLSSEATTQQQPDVTSQALKETQQPPMTQPVPVVRQESRATIQDTMAANPPQAILTRKLLDTRQHLLVVTQQLRTCRLLMQVGAAHPGT